MSMVTVQAEFLLQACELVQWATAEGYVITGGELWRSVEQQKIYVSTGRSKTMQSSHLDRLAIDLNIFKDGKLCTREQIKPIGDRWEAMHPKNRWGGNWRGLVDAGKSSFVDAPHFERQLG